MRTVEQTITCLKLIEKKNRKFFKDNNLDILDCVTFIGEGLVSVHITNNSLPHKIRYEIESLFWRPDDGVNFPKRGLKK